MPKITKDEAAALLDKTPRAVERYAAAGRLSVTYAKGKTRDIPQYDRAEVEALAEELQKPSTPARGTVATPGDNGDKGMSQAVAIRSHALERQPSAEGMQTFALMVADALRGAQTHANGTGGAVSVSIADKLMLSIDEAAALAGLSANHVREAIKAGRLKAKIVGRGWRVKRPDLDAYVKKL
jgi:excisionase family DNA binding protein